MTQRSRLRTREGKRRWLVLLILLVAAGAGGTVWYAVSFRPGLVGELAGPWALKQWRTPVNRDFVRGTIYDRNYKELAVSYERVSVYANIREIKTLETVVKPLAGVLEEPEETIQQLLSASGLRLWLARDITQRQEEEIRKLQLPGIFLHKEFVRHHPWKESAAHLLGFVENDTGLSGIEFYLNQLQAKHRINPGKVEALKKVGDSVPGADGRHLILTLDLKIQALLEQYVDEHSGGQADLAMGVIAVEATTGAIVGYAQKPSFDPNRFHTYSESVFADIFNQPVAVPAPIKQFLRDFSLLESQANGIVLPWSIVAEKRKLGVQLQLWEKLGIARPEEYDFISATAALSDRVAFDLTGSGHRDFETVPAMLTPLQMLTALLRTVGGGKKIVLHVSDRYVIRRNQSEYLLEDLKPQQGTVPFQDGTPAEIVQLLADVGKSEPLRSVVIGGNSCSYGRQNGFQTFIQYGISFAMVPLPDTELILMVINSRPGYDVAGKDADQPTSEIFRLIAPVSARQKVMKTLADMMKPKEQEEKNFSLSESRGIESSALPSQMEKESDVLITKMPDLVGMSLRKSLRYLQNSDVEVKINGTGRVVSHDPPAGAALVSGSTVTLNLQRDEVEDAGRPEDSTGE